MDLSKPIEQLLLSRKECAVALGLSIGTIDVLIRRGLLKTVEKGRRTLVHRNEVTRFSRLDHTMLWPRKQNGKTVRAESDDSPLLFKAS